MRNTNYPRNNRRAERRATNRPKRLPLILLRRMMRSPDPAIRYNMFWDWYGDSWHSGNLMVARRIMLHDPDRWVRERATYVLSFSFRNRWVIPSLLAVYKNTDEHPRVRAQAAEGLANKMGCWGRSALRRTERLYGSVIAALLEGLHDPSPHVRFWSVFALWQIDDRVALPELERLAATDHAICPGWWTVAEEASDAVASLTNATVDRSYDRPMQRDTLTADDICPYQGI